MKRKLIQTLAIAAGVLVGVCAMAQEPAGPPQGGPQGGFQGGPQGGPNGGRMGGPPPMMGRRPQGGPAILLRPEVRDELKLTDDQVKKIETEFHIKAHGPQGRADRRGPGERGPGAGGPGPDGPRPGGPGMEGGPGMPPPPMGGGEEGGPGMPPPPNDSFGGPEGGPRMGRPEGPGNAARIAEAEKKLKGILNDKQFTRYREISLQMAGPDAVMRPDIAQQLGLSEDQKTKIQAILEKNRPKDGPMGGPLDGPRGAGGNRPPRPQGDENDRPPMPPQGEGLGGPGGPEGFGGPGGPGRPGGPGGPNPEERKKLETQILAVLTDAQKSQWKTMLGKPFEPRRPEGRPPQGGPQDGDPQPPEGF